VCVFVVALQKLITLMAKNPPNEKPPKEGKLTNKRKKTFDSRLIYSDDDRPRHSPGTYREQLKTSPQVVKNSVLLFAHFNRLHAEVLSCYRYVLFKWF
jgi:hypothetical protein